MGKGKDKYHYYKAASADGLTQYYRIGLSGGTTPWPGAIIDALGKKHPIVNFVRVSEAEAVSAWGEQNRSKEAPNHA